MVKTGQIRKTDLDKLEYTRFLELLSQFTPNDLTRNRIISTVYETDPVKVKEKVETSKEFIEILQRHGYIPLSEIPDISDSLELLSIEESVLPAEELLNIAYLLKTSRELKNFLKDEIKDSSHISKLYRELYSSRETEKIIYDSIDESGMVKDSASRDLARIRKSIKEVEAQITGILERIVYSQKYEDVIQEKLITVRRGRYVIPVKQNFSGKIQGIIQDRSSSGQTVYLEPVSVVQLNNRLSDLKLKESIEVRRVLKFLTDILREKLSGIKKTFNTLIQFDYLYAVGKYALKYRCTFPEISDDVHLVEAKHPVFLLMDRGFRPIDIKLGSRKKGLIITGPNTGGKTVALKTAGILAMLNQSGIPVPVSEESRIPIFDGIFADIGDMQSIEHNLSTFSAHIKNIKEILSFISENSLVLLDELIPGTDPDEGSALGIGILEKIKSTGSYVIATTHFRQIKTYALSEDYFNVASVGFDRETLSPTYTLHYGFAGQSMAFYIAEKLGLDSSIIQTAREHLDESYERLNQALSSLEVYKTAHQKELEEIRELKKQLKEEKERYSKLKEELEEEKRKKWETVKKEAEDYIKFFREKGYKILEEVKHTKSGKKLEQFLTESRKEINTGFSEEDTYFSFNIGDTVKLKGKNTVGEIISIREDRVHINFNGLKIWAKLSDIEPAEKKEEKKVKFSFSRKRETAFRPELKIIGKTKEEALKELEQFIDRAITEGFSTVRVVHGYGTGVLRKAVREYLDSLPYRISYEDAPYNEGGMGVTIVHIN
ncbi:endonuclease MutS2 [Persephonella sp.]